MKKINNFVCLFISAFVFLAYLTSAKAENVDEAYELINYSFTPEVGGKTVNEIGFNSAVNGASDHYSAETKALAKAIYPGDTSTKLNPWPPEPPWYADARAEYANKFETA